MKREYAHEPPIVSVTQLNPEQCEVLLHENINAEMRLYLDGGVWEDKQIVPAAWVAESTREHSRCLEWGKLPYGYLWWIIDQESFAALGDGGNAIYVNTKKRMVIAIASFLTPDAKDRIKWIKTRIEPLFS